jgi:hypothetical protein
LYTADSVPVDDSGTVRLLARLSPVGKLRVDDGGVLVGVGVTAKKPPDSCWVTVTLPVTATALAGMPALPVTCQVRAALAVNLPERPTAMRESSTRAGVIGTYVVPAGWRRETHVFHSAPVPEYWLACQTADGTRGSWGTPT